MILPSRRLMIMLLALLMLLSAPGLVQAETSNSVNRAVSVAKDYSGYPRTDLTITEKEDFPDQIQTGDTFEIILPLGVEWASDSSGRASYKSEYLICQNCTVEAILRNARTVELTFVDTDPTEVSRLEIPLVFAVKDFLGDIEVTIEPLDSNISGGRYLFARVPYKLVPVPIPDPDPEPAPQPTQQHVVFTIGSPFYSLDGKQQAEMDVAPYIKDDRTYLPVRFVANNLGIVDEHIQWLAETRSVVLSKGDQTVQIWIGSRALNHNGTLIDMDVAPEIWQDRTMLPIAPIAEALGASVEWDPVMRTVIISMAKN